MSAIATSTIAPSGLVRGSDRERGAAVAFLDDGEPEFGGEPVHQLQDRRVVVDDQQRRQSRGFN